MEEGEVGVAHSLLFPFFSSIATEKEEKMGAKVEEELDMGRERRKGWKVTQAIIQRRSSCLGLGTYVGGRRRRRRCLQKRGRGDTLQPNAKVWLDQSRQFAKSLVSQATEKEKKGMKAW